MLLGISVFIPNAGVTALHAAPEGLPSRGKTLDSGAGGAFGQESPRGLKRNIVDFGARCDGVANDYEAFTRFNAWARAQTEPVVLVLSRGSVCTIKSGGVGPGNFFAKGIKKLYIIGYGATLSDGKGAGSFFLAGRGQFQDNTHSARTLTANAGATFITLKSPKQAGLFKPGHYALLTGFDLQGLWQSPYGYPSNAHYFEYVKIKDVNASSGVVCVETPIKNTYLSTWPSYNSGSAFEVDNGGPATLYALDPSWDTEVEYRGLTIDRPTAQSYANGRSITFRDVTFTGAGGAIPTQNLLWQAIDSHFPNANMEVDKFVTDMKLENVTIRAINFQSSSVDNATIVGSTVTGYLNGSPKRIEITNSTLNSFQPGAWAYGRSEEVNCTNSVIRSFGALGLTERNFSKNFTLVNGVFVIPKGTLVTNVIRNESGNVRLLVTSSANFLTGGTYRISGVQGTKEANGEHVIAIVDAQTIDLPSVAFAHAYRGGGKIQVGAQRWAVPGSTVIISGQYSNEAMFKVRDVTEDATTTYVHTNLTDGYPAVPVYAGNGALSIRTHPAPRVTFRDCTGAPAVEELSQAPAGAPLYSFSRRTYDGSVPAPEGSTVWGALVSAKFNVVEPYSGDLPKATINPLGRFHYPAIRADGSVFDYVPVLNLKAEGTRTITPLEVLGGQSGDAALSIPGSVWFTQAYSPFFNAGPSKAASGTSPRVTIEIVTDQGVTEP